MSVQLSTSSVDATPFPSDRFTVSDTTQYTARRIALPLPDCSVRVSDCADLSLINTLDGFNTQPRISIPFTGDIDPATITTDTVYLLQVGDAQTGAARGQRVGINQATWDSATKTIFVESDQLLAEHARYLLVVTDGIRDLQGRRLSRGAWHNAATGKASGPDGTAYATALAEAMNVVPPGENLIAASLFTTRSSTIELTRIQQAVQASTPAAAVDFMIGTQAGAPCSIALRWQAFGCSGRPPGCRRLPRRPSRSRTSTCEAPWLAKSPTDATRRSAISTPTITSRAWRRSKACRSLSRPMTWSCRSSSRPARARRADGR